MIDYIREGGDAALVSWDGFRVRQRIRDILCSVLRESANIKRKKRQNEL